MIQWFRFVMIVLTLAGCAQSPSSNSAPAQLTSYTLEDLGPYGVAPFKTFPLAWDQVKADGPIWSGFVLKVLHEETPQLLSGAEDIEIFCPAYHSMNTNDRANFWALLISGITRYESSYNPLSRMVETTMGKDPITGKQVVSEGLLQLSYQDVRSYPYCEFDWNRDRELAGNDPRKTILDPYRNLRCGVKILAHQIARRHRITLGSGMYWAVLKQGGRHSKIEQIAALTKKMPGCNKEP